MDIFEFGKIADSGVIIVFVGFFVINDSYFDALFGSISDGFANFAIGKAINGYIKRFLRAFNGLNKAFYGFFLFLGHKIKLFGKNKRAEKKIKAKNTKKFFQH